MRLVLLFIAVFGIVGSLARDVFACTCIDWPVDRRMAEAGPIFLGRVGKRTIDGDNEVQHFSVLHALKGTVAHDYTLRRPRDLDCERTFQSDELALVFVVKGRVPICAGNVDLDVLMPSLGDYFVPETGAVLPSMDALAVALAGRFGRAKQVSIYFPALAGKSLSAKGVRVMFTDKQPDDLPVLNAVRSGPLTYVSLRRLDSIVSSILVANEHGRLAVIHETQRDLRIK